jgi:urease beta subunit
MALGALTALATAAYGKQKVEISSTETIALEPGGRIRVVNSIGEVRVEGWDRPEVEVRVVRATNREYSETDQAEARRRLEQVKVRTWKEPGGTLRIETVFPERELFTRPLRGKSNVNVRYTIKAPANTSLAIDHDVGEVAVRGLKADIEISNRIGEVNVKLPGNEPYRVNAKVRLGEVNSQLAGTTRRRFLSHEFVSVERSQGRRLLLQVGIGEINVKREGAPEDKGRII